jgi:methyl-accepting chemotaxis protein
MRRDMSTNETAPAVPLAAIKSPKASWHFANNQSNLYLSLAILAAAGAITFVHHVPGLYPLAFLAMMSWYAAASHRLLKEGALHIDLVVVSEQIIACGIASLVAHIAMAVSTTSFVMLAGDSPSTSEVRVAALVFAEGLGCAAVAPIIAMVLRSTSLTPSSVAEDAQVAALEATATALKEFVRKSTTLNRNMDRLANSMDQSVHRYAEATDGVVASLARLEKDIEGQSTSVGLHLSELDAKIRALGDGAARTTAELRRAATDTSALFTAGDESARKLGESMELLAGRLRSTSELLNGLDTLISSVDSFVRSNSAEQAAEPHRREAEHD